MGVAQQVSATGEYSSHSQPIRAAQWACSLYLLSAACAMRASFRGPSLPSTPGCPPYFNAIRRPTPNESLHLRTSTPNYSAEVKYFRGGNTPPPKKFLPPPQPNCFVPFHPPSSLTHKKCRAISSRRTPQY